MDIEKIIESSNLKKFSKQKCYRLIPNKFPPIALFEDVADSNEFDALFEIQELTNPRVNFEIGKIGNIPEEDRAYGIKGAGFVMATFTHINPIGSRFSDGSFGVYYASNKLNTAMKETVYHREQFFAATNEEPQDIVMRCLVANFNGSLVDFTTKPYSDINIYDKHDYSQSQSIGCHAKMLKYNGIFYQSVRDINGLNYAIFKPKLITECIQQAHYTYEWDGQKIANVYKKELVDFG